MISKEEEEEEEEGKSAYRFYSRCYDSANHLSYSPGVTTSQ